MRIVSAGAGNLATHLSKALRDAGFQIVQVFSRTETSAKELAEKLQTPYYTTDMDAITKDASLYIISVSDDVIESLSKKLTFVEGLVVHTAGSVPMDVFAGKTKNFGVLYPLQTFRKLRPSIFPKYLFLSKPIRRTICKNYAWLRRQFLKRYSTLRRKSVCNCIWQQFLGVIL